MPNQTQNTNYNQTGSHSQYSSRNNGVLQSRQMDSVFPVQVNINDSQPYQTPQPALNKTLPFTNHLSDKSTSPTITNNLTHTIPGLNVSSQDVYRPTSTVYPQYRAVPNTPQNPNDSTTISNTNVYIPEPTQPNLTVNHLTHQSNQNNSSNNNYTSFLDNSFSRGGSSTTVDSNAVTKSIIDGVDRANTAPHLVTQNHLPSKTVQHTQSTPPKIEYVNPNNIKIPHRPESYADLKTQALENEKQPPTVSTEVYQKHYDQLQKQNTKLEIDTHEILKLVLYVIPVIAVFIIIFKAPNSEEVLWHARQSVIAQVFWLLVLYILNGTGAPLIAGNGFTLATLWNIICITNLVYAGAQAYLGKKHKIPLVYDIASGFIDQNKEA